MYEQARESMEDEARQYEESFNYDPLETYMLDTYTGEIKSYDEWVVDFIKASDACEWYVCMGADEFGYHGHPDGFDACESGLIEVYFDDETGRWENA